MLYASLLLGGLLFLSKGQDCTYSADLADDNLYSNSKFENSLDQYSKDGSEQYVIFDFNFADGDVKGSYFLPFIFTDEDGNTVCHSPTFSQSVWMDFTCSSGYDAGSQDSETTVTMTWYQGDDCDTGAATFSYWWDEGYSPYYDPETLVPATSSVCNTTEACVAMNLTRSLVTQGSGSRYDFSCEGESEYVTATLCGESTCSTLCATVNAAIGAGCLATPNSTFGNLMVSCNDKNAYLTTFVDVNQYAIAAATGQMWNDYTVDRTCSNSPEYTSDQLSGGGYICNQYEIPKDECTFTFDFPALNAKVYGYMDECTDPFSSAANSMSFSFIAISFSVIIAIFKL